MDGISDGSVINSNMSMHGKMNGKLW
jgi:hypothetical protein